jgi:hypothetical protein
MLPSAEGARAPWQGKRYEGRRAGDYGTSILVEGVGEPYPLPFVDKHEHGRRFFGEASPRPTPGGSGWGWEWGYLGTGPSNTAASILADHLGVPPPLLVAHLFKERFLGGLSRRPGDGWVLTGEQIDEWLQLPRVRQALAAGWEAVRLHEAEAAELARLQEAEEAAQDAAFRAKAADDAEAREWFGAEDGP